MLTLHVGDVQRRNWSCVATGQLHASTSPASPRAVFIKQFVDATGNAHAKQCEFERQGAALASTLLSHAVHVPALLHVDAQRLLHVYGFCELTSLDVLLRERTAAFDAQFTLAMKAMHAVLVALADGTQTAAGTAKLASKERPYGGSSSAVNFKGLDIRNVGLINAGPAKGDVANFAMFDFGRPYLAPIEEAAAKLFVSVGLLNWGRPVTRFARGPQTDLLKIARTHLAEFLDRDAVVAEIHYQQRTRERDIKAPSRTATALKRAGMKTLGRAYFRRLETWCKTALPSPQTR